MWQKGEAYESSPTKEQEIEKENLHPQGDQEGTEAIGFAIPKAPFQSVVKETCDSWQIGFRWNRTAILVLQEMAEDYLEKFFEDAMLVAAHAHRVTLMAKDFNTLARARYRYDKLLHLVEW